MHVIRSVYSFVFFMDTIKVRVSLPLQKKMLVVHLMILAFFFFSIDLTLGCASVLHCSEKSVALLCDIGGSSVLLRFLLVPPMKVEAAHSSQGCWKKLVFFLACHS